MAFKLQTLGVIGFLLSTSWSAQAATQYVVCEASMFGPEKNYFSEIIVVDQSQVENINQRWVKFIERYGNSVLPSCTNLDTQQQAERLTNSIVRVAQKRSSQIIWTDFKSTVSKDLSTQDAQGGQHFTPQSQGGKSPTSTSTNGQGNSGRFSIWCDINYIGFSKVPALITFDISKMRYCRWRSDISKSTQGSASCEKLRQVNEDTLVFIDAISEDGNGFMKELIDRHSGIYFYDLGNFTHLQDVKSFQGNCQPVKYQPMPSQAF